MKPGNPCCKDILSDRLIATLRQAAKSWTCAAPPLLRVAVDVDGLVPADWLAAQNADVKVYWANRRGDFEAAGSGAADVLMDDGCQTVSEVLAEIDRRVAVADGRVRYYGGIAFDCEEEAHPGHVAEGGSCFDRGPRYWPGFGRYRFIMPQMEVRREDGDMTFAVNLACRSDDTVETLEQQIQRILQEVVFNGEMDDDLTEPTRILNRSDLPDRAAWTCMVGGAMGDLAGGVLDKIVLSRQAVLTMSAPVDPSDLLNSIAHHSAGAYIFCFQLRRHDAFIGASPECLYSRCGGEIYSEAVAGTVLSGSTDVERRRHRGILSDSAKDREEHAYVFDGVHGGLGRLCDDVRVIDERDIVSLGYVQHFCSRFAGRLRANVAAADIIAALHPTAAVNGHPRSAALDQIRQREPFTRGWYAGPVGWIAADGSEFAVAIRSARLFYDRMTLFAGAGIVRSSDPDGEWDETESKLSLFLNAAARL
ncbi:MAG: isochorismate synthase [Phycisphaerae bacterium]|nr:isochorismate synthase [Phycisphaerae bacterium]